MATRDYPPDEEIVEETTKSLIAKEGTREIARKGEMTLTRHFTRHNDKAYDFIKEAAERGDRVVIKQHDGLSNETLPIFVNEGHSPGVSASWLMAEVIGSKSTIADDVAQFSYYGKIVNPDFWKIEVYHNWRKGTK